MGEKVLYIAFKVNIFILLSEEVTRNIIIAADEICSLVSIVVPWCFALL